jgi:hypothetical protein
MVGKGSGLGRGFGLVPLKAAKGLETSLFSGRGLCLGAPSGTEGAEDERASGEIQTTV